MTVRGRGSADEAVVAVKLRACEDAVTYPRIKLSVSDKDVGGEGRNMCLSFGSFIMNYHYEFCHMDRALGAERISVPYRIRAGMMT